MKTKLITLLSFVSMLVFTACEETTDMIGSSLTTAADRLDVRTDTFNVYSRTLMVDSVLSRNYHGYLGQVKDPETGSYISSHFMAQLHVLGTFAFVGIDSIASKQDGKVFADSCDIRLYRSSYYGDTLTQMKLTMYEMDHPLEEGSLYYSNYDPEKKGYIRTNGLKQSRTYTQSDLTTSSTSTNPYIRIKLNDPYTDKDGKVYKNYGTYIMQKYFENPKNFSTQYLFSHNICPGFYFKSTSGLGSMSEISHVQLGIHYRMTFDGGDSIFTASTILTSTEEVLQTTTVENDKQTLGKLAADNTCTYLKTPSGLFTEVTLPVDEIMDGHLNDSVNTAKLILTRINSNVNSDYNFDSPTDLLLVQKDSLISFFEQSRLANNKNTYLATYNSVLNNYEFSNISGLVKIMYNLKKNGLASKDWNKAVIVPVTLTEVTQSSGTSTVTRIVHNMELTSTKLIGGSENPNDPIKISVIYGKFD